MQYASREPEALSIPDLRASWDDGFAARDGRIRVVTHYRLEQDGARVTLITRTANAVTGAEGDVSTVQGTIVHASPERHIARIHLDDHRIVFFDLEKRRFASADRNVRMTLRFTRPEGWPPGDLAPIGALLGELYRVATDGRSVSFDPSIDAHGSIAWDGPDGLVLRGEYREERGDRPLHLHLVLDGPQVPFRFDLGLTRTHHPHRLLLDGMLTAVMLRDRAQELAEASSKVLEAKGLGPVEIRIWKR